MTRVKSDKEKRLARKGIRPCYVGGKSYRTKEEAEAAGGFMTEAWYCDACYYWHWRMIKK